VCCPVVDSCPDGSTPTPNHVDDVEGTCGSVCCKVKADYSGVYYDEWDDAYSESYSGWKIVGATNGECCSGYTHFDVEGAGVESYITDDTWEIKNNNGGYYCANSSEGIEYWDIDECYADVKSYYPNSSKVCYSRKWYCPEADPGDTVCCTSEKGEPGDICESSDVTF